MVSSFRCHHAYTLNRNNTTLSLKTDTLLIGDRPNRVQSLDSFVFAFSSIKTKNHPIISVLGLGPRSSPQLKLVKLTPREISKYSSMEELPSQDPNITTISLLRVAGITLIVVILADLLAKKLIKYLQFRKKLNELPGPDVVNPILGNIPSSVLGLIANGGNSERSKEAADQFYTSQIQSVLGHTLIYKEEPLFRLWLGQEPVVCVWKPEIVELVLNDSFLLEKSYHYDFLRPWLGNGLLTSPGKIWRPRRKLLVPSFHFNILQAFVPVFDRKSKHLVRNLKQKLNASLGALDESTVKSRGVVVDITPVITACTLDAICETIMGVSIDAQKNPNNDYCQSIYIVGETFLERIIQPRYWLDWIFRHTELGKLYNYHLDKLHSFTRRVISEKKREKLAGGDTSETKDETQPRTNPNQEPTISLENNLRLLDQTSVDQFQANHKDVPKLPKAFLDLLLDKINLSADGGAQKLSDEEIREEVDTFMFEGHDTTAMALSWTLFLLGHNRHVQQRLWQEVDELFESEHLNDEVEALELDHLKKLKYLECVIKEALRLCPSVPFIGRQTTSELKLGNYSVPPNSVIFVLIYQLHRDGKIYPNPEQFDPDRFLPENLIGRHPFAYVPFSAGPRNCIGQKFAMAEMKSILLHLTRNFEFESITPLDKAKVQMEMVLRPKSALNIRVKPRER